MQMYWDKFASDQAYGMTQDEFARGYMAADASVGEDQVYEAFTYGDMDLNGRLSWEEFQKLYWEGQNDGRDHGGDGSMEMSAKDMYNKFARSDPNKGMSYDEFAEGYRFADPGVTDAMIDEAFMSGDQNQDYVLDHKEFIMLYQMGKNEGEAMEYWNRYSVSGMMSWSGFETAWMEAEPGVEKRTIEEGWMMGLGQTTLDQSVMMSLDQFIRLVHSED